MSTPDTLTHFRTCNLCEAMCGIAIGVEGGRVVSIRGDEDDPFSRGHICPKAVALQDLHEDPDRLRRPLRRRGTDWEEIGWDEALDEAAERLAAIQRRTDATRSRSTRATRPSTTTARLLFGQRAAAQPWARAAATPRRRSTSFRRCWRPCSMFGHQLLLPVPDVDRTRYFLVLGANPLASNGSLMTAPGIERRLRDLQARGGRLVVVDPAAHRDGGARRPAPPHPPGHGRAAAAGDAARAVRRGADAAGRSGRVHRRARRRARAGGAVRARERRGQRPACLRASSRQLARDFAASGAAVATAASASRRRSSAALASWLLNVLNVVTGNLDRAGRRDVHAPGGGPRRPRRPRRPARPLRQGPQPRARPARVRRRVPGGGPGRGDGDARRAGQIRALVTVAGNPVLSTPNGARLDARARRPRLHGLDRPLPQRDHAPRAPHPAADDGARARPLRRRLPHARRAQHGEATRRRSSRPAGRAPRLADPARPGPTPRRPQGPPRLAGTSDLRAPRPPGTARPRGRHDAERALRILAAAVRRAVAAAPAALPARRRPGRAPAVSARDGSTRGDRRIRAGARPLRARPRAAARVGGRVRRRAAAHRPTRPALEQQLDAQQPRGW